MPHSPSVASHFPELNPMSADRRHEQREEPATTADDRTPWIDRHWPKLAWICTLLFGGCTLTTKALGLHIAGPSDTIAAQARSDTTRDGRITQLERRADHFDVAITLQSYMLCVNNRVHDDIVLGQCSAIIREMQKRVAP
jgi:hypothetical protein